MPEANLEQQKLITAWRGEFEQGYLPEHAAAVHDYLGKEAARMLAIVDLFSTNEVSAKVKSFIEKKLVEYPEYENMLARTVTPGLERIERLDFSLSFYFQSVTEVTNLVPQVASENTILHLASPEFRTHAFAYDLFLLQKGIELFKVNGGGMIAEFLEQIHPNLVIARTSDLGATLDTRSHNVVTVQAENKALYVLLGFPYIDSSGEFDSKTLAATVAAVHELAHVLAKVAFNGAIRPLQLIQDPIKTYNDPRRYDEHSRDLSKPTVVNVIEEAAAIFTETIVARGLPGGVEQLDDYSKLRKDVKYQEATKLADSWVEQGLSLPQLPAFLGNLREKLEEVDIYRARLEDSETLQIEYEQAMKLIAEWDSNNN